MVWALNNDIRDTGAILHRAGRGAFGGPAAGLLVLRGRDLALTRFGNACVGRRAIMLSHSLRALDVGLDKPLEWVVC